jgi:hypothetical protein
MDNQIGKKPYGYIYVSFFPPTIKHPKEGFYIGQKKLSKSNKYSFDPNYHGSGVLVRKYIKLHPDSKITTVCLIYANSKEELDSLENYWVSFKIKGKEYPNSLNLRAGGNSVNTSEETAHKISKTLLGHPGHRFTKEERDRISKSHQGRSGHKFTNIERSKISKAKRGCKGHPCSKETRHKLSVLHTGLKHSEETKMKMSEVRKKFLLSHPEYRFTDHPKRRSVICLETGEIFRSSYAAHKAHSDAACGTILQCCKGVKHYNTAGGFHWAFLNEDGSSIALLNK